MDFTNYSTLVRCGFHSNKISHLNERSSIRLEDQFDDWLSKSNDDLQKIKIGSPAIISAWAHGGSHYLDDPFPMYAAETYLQGEGIPYEVHYDFPDGAQKYSVGIDEMKRI